MDRTAAAGLLTDKKRCKIIIDEWCLIGDSVAGKKTRSIFGDVWGIRDWWILADEVSRSVGTGE